MSHFDLGFVILVTILSMPQIFCHVFEAYYASTYQAHIISYVLYFEDMCLISFHHK